MARRDDPATVVWAPEPVSGRACPDPQRSMLEVRAQARPESCAALWSEGLRAVIGDSDRAFRIAHGTVRGMFVTVGETQGVADFVNRHDPDAPLPVSLDRCGCFFQLGSKPMRTENRRSSR